MICSLLLDPDDSVDFPGNKGMALGRPLSAYPIKAARASAHIRKHYVVSDSPPVKAVAAQYGAIIVDPPQAAAGSLTPAERQLLHGYAHIRDELKGEKEALDYLVVLLSNAPAVATDLIDKGLEALHEKQDLDSAVSVSPYNRWNPFSAKREAAGGLLEPYVPYAADARGDVWYPDWGVVILRPRCLDDRSGPPPHAWMGKSILPLKQWGGGPIDYQWQIPTLEYWLKKHGYTDKSASLEMQPKPQPQLAPKGDRR